jgi:hypothetical protein
MLCSTVNVNIRCRLSPMSTYTAPVCDYDESMLFSIPWSGIETPAPAEGVVLSRG